MFVGSCWKANLEIDWLVVGDLNLDRLGLDRLAVGVTVRHRSGSVVDVVEGRRGSGGCRRGVIQIDGVQVGGRRRGLQIKCGQRQTILTADQKQE